MRKLSAMFMAVLLMAAVPAFMPLRTYAASSSPQVSASNQQAQVAALQAAVAALQAQIAVLQAKNAAQETVINKLQSSLTDIQATDSARDTKISSLKSDVHEILNSNVFALNPYLTVDTTDSIEQATGLKGPHIIFTGANVHIRNGTGGTGINWEEYRGCTNLYNFEEPNGLGNLIIGYNEPRANDDCMPYLARRGGSHNIVVGPLHLYTKTGGLVAGFHNAITGPWCSVTGGVNNEAGNYASSVSGGRDSSASGICGSVSGGSNNTAGYYASTVAASVTGGSNNLASDNYASVSGGSGNVAGVAGSSVSGGINRSIPFGYTWGAGSLLEVQ